jgi:hypothetical protein
LQRMGRYTSNESLRVSDMSSLPLSNVPLIQEK